MGLSGSGAGEYKRILDPEALLVFSLEAARYDPRLFDEIIDWLIKNGGVMDIQRLRGIIKSRNPGTQALLGAVAAILMKEAKSYRRKWQSLSRCGRNKGIDKKEILFKTRDNKDYPVIGGEDDIFSEYALSRPVFSASGKSKKANPKKPSNIRFMLRSLLGTGSRAECILYLMTHDWGHPSRVADAIGLSVRGTQDALIDLAGSGLVLEGRPGKRKKEYRLSQGKWWKFLLDIDIEETRPPEWINWIAMYESLSGVLSLLNNISETDSDYIRSSKMRQSMDTIVKRLMESEMELPPFPGPNIPPRKYEKEFKEFISKILEQS